MKKIDTEAYYNELISEILKGNIHTKDEIHKLKLNLCKRYSIRYIPKDADILNSLNETSKVSILRTKQSRSISGVSVVAVMSSPSGCPHGKCDYCPGGVEYNTPQSYTGKEPAALRAEQCGFDPYLQVKTRLEQLQTIGHNIEKIDLIIMGGTFTARDEKYQEEFVKRCFDALNMNQMSTLKEAISFNEKAKSRCVGLTVETRPDRCSINEITRILRFGTTRIELGVQSIDDEILTNVNRGHTTEDTITATERIKNAGLKLCYHIMPGLPGSDIAHDLHIFKKIFSDSRFMPDMLKIYPTLVIEGTVLYEKWRAGEYKPMNTDTAVRLLTQVKSKVPPWVRIQRIQRDIPAHLIVDGVKKSNLRQIVQREMNTRGMKCRCIRCREVGRKIMNENIHVDTDKIILSVDVYEASGGKEFFVSFVEPKKDILIGYARLRELSEPFTDELKESMIIRELKVFGEVVGINKTPDSKYSWQHMGYGKKLVSRCEEITADRGYRKITVNSGIGARNYYRKLGYKLGKIYMWKDIG